MVMINIIVKDGSDIHKIRNHSTNFGFITHILRSPLILSGVKLAHAPIIEMDYRLFLFLE
jgi:hypothetical protein